MYTEEEAKTKWCPMARTLMSVVRGNNTSHGSVNNGHNEDGTTFRTMCIASGCMMWEWIKIEDPTKHKGYGKMVDSDKGHCGLTK